jgi:hypothetical protein
VKNRLRQHNRQYRGGEIDNHAGNQ